MDERALQIVLNYIHDVFYYLDRYDDDFDIFIVWKCKTLQNWKYLISTSVGDGMYYELTYNGDRREWYLDAYKKFQNRVYRDDDYTNYA